MKHFKISNNDKNKAKKEKQPSSSTSAETTSAGTTSAGTTSSSTPKASSAHKAKHQKSYEEFIQESKKGLGSAVKKPQHLSSRSFFKEVMSTIKTATTKDNNTMQQNLGYYSSPIVSKSCFKTKESLSEVSEPCQSTTSCIMTTSESIKSEKISSNSQVIDPENELCASLEKLRITDTKTTSYLKTLKPLSGSKKERPKERELLPSSLENAIESISESLTHQQFFKSSLEKIDIFQPSQISSLVKEPSNPERTATMHPVKKIIEPPSVTSKRLESISKEENKREYYKKLGAIPKTSRYKAQQSVSNIKKEGSYSTRFHASKGLSTERKTKVPTLPLKDIVKRSDVSAFSWKPSTEPLETPRYSRTQVLKTPKMPIISENSIPKTKERPKKAVPAQSLEKKNNKFQKNPLLAAKPSPKIPLKSKKGEDSLGMSSKTITLDISVALQVKSLKPDDCIEDKNKDLSEDTLQVKSLKPDDCIEDKNKDLSEDTLQVKSLKPDDCIEDKNKDLSEETHHESISLCDVKHQSEKQIAQEIISPTNTTFLKSSPCSDDSQLNTLASEDFKHELGEAILDSIFFENDEFDDYEDYYDEEDIEYLLSNTSRRHTQNLEVNEDEHDTEEETALNLDISPVIQNKPLKRCYGQGGGTDSPDLEFVYDDADTHGNEIAELYSYTEQPELQLNVKAFEDQMESYHLPPSWQRLSVEKRKSVVMKLLDQLEISKKPLRMRSARCLLYIAQGCWAEMQSDTEQQHWARINSMLLYQLGAFSAFTDLLNIEIENSTAAHVAMRKIAVSLADSQDLRVILSVLYTITEVIRNESATDNIEYSNDIEAFCFEIGNASGDDLLVIKLLGMVTRFCSGAAPHFPMKKVLLLLWKLILVSLGGMTTLKDLKAKKRQHAGLPLQDEDTMEIAKTMRSSSPPASASDLLEAQNQKRNTRPFRRSLMKQSSLDDQESLGMEIETTMGSDNADDLADMTEYDERRPTDNSEASQMYSTHNINMYNRQMSPPLQHDVLPRGLPWKPKVRQKDIDMFLDGARQKFLGYSLPGDQSTLFGLPEPIHEGVKILKEHVYTSLAELQIQKEEEMARNPLSTEEDEVEHTSAEILYQAMLPNLPQYMIALLKILLAAAPTSKAKTDSINIMSDVLPEEMPMTVLQSMKLGIDVNRHKEIIVKAVSAVLLLLLKHFKLNHIYQFEFMSQHLVFANCIPLVLKFFNQNIMAYVGAKNVIPILDFPSCVIGDQPELTAESLEIGDAATFSWRNMFSCINLLRILNKLTKWKHSRIMMLVVFKSAPILKRTLKVRHAMTQLYVLKLLKMQTKYLGRQWRKSNMKTISAIYQKVRHRLNDDWAYGNDLDARPWDFQAEECALRASVDRFNNRRYTLVNESEFEPVDNSLNSVLGTSHDLSESFKAHYILWLEQEVFGTPIEWEKLLFNGGK